MLPIDVVNGGNQTARGAQQNYIILKFKKSDAVKVLEIKDVVNAGKHNDIIRKFQKSDVLSGGKQNDIIQKFPKSDVVQVEQSKPT